MAEQSIAGAAGRVTAAEGDRSARARIVILLLSLALALSMFLSLTSGASDASAVRVIRDWLTGAVPADAALAARDQLIVYDVRMPRVLLGVLIG
ncbi:MAG: iron ABC transporter, partial [Mesorhizobium sp.]